MKKLITISLTVAAFVALQGCARSGNDDSKTLSANEKAIATADSVKRAAVVKHDKLLAEWKVQEEKRKMDKEELAKKTPTYKDSKGRTIYNKAEVEPTFSGGEEAMNLYLQENIAYPNDAEQEGLEGTVYVDFIIAANGTVDEVTVGNTSYQEVDQRFQDEAVRVVSLMPKWVPGRQHGVAVDVKHSLPVTFRLM